MIVLAIIGISGLLLNLINVEGRYLQKVVSDIVGFIGIKLVRKVYNCLLCSSFWLVTFIAISVWMFFDKNVFIYIPIMTIGTVYAYKILE